jgi:hypothetical protein
MKKESLTKHLIAIALLLAVVFVMVEIYKMISAGITDVKTIVSAPWNAAKKLWNDLTGWFGSIGGVANNYGLPALQTSPLTAGFLSPPAEQPAPQPGTLDINAINDAIAGYNATNGALAGTPLYTGP